MECEFCKKTFSTKPNLLRHQRTANYCIELQGKSPLKNVCDYCNNSFTEKSSLNRHLLNCKVKRDDDVRKRITKIKAKYEKRILELQEGYQTEIKLKSSEIENLKKVIEDRNEEITELRIKCGSSHANGKVEVYDKVCTKVLEKPTVNNTNNTMNIHPKLVNLPITNIHPLTEDYVKDSVSNGGYTFEQYLKGENGLVDFIYSITMCEDNDGNIERNYVCTDPSRDSYHRLVDTKEWQKDKGGKFVDVILDTISDKADSYHMKLLDERMNTSQTTSSERKLKLGYDPEYIYKINTDMHSGIVQPKGKERRVLRQKIKKETSRKISV